MYIELRSHRLGSSRYQVFSFFLALLLEKKGVVRRRGKKGKERESERVLARSETLPLRFQQR